MSAEASAGGPAVPADRLAELRRERADRLKRLRGAGADAADPDSELAAFLGALRAAIAEPPPGPRAPPPAAAAETGRPAAAVLRFLRAPDRAPSPRPAEPTRPGPAAPASQPGDLDRLPGVGPGLIWALEQAGVARLADLATRAPAPLADRLGPIGGLIDLPGWIAFARSATGTASGSTPPPG